MTTAIIGCGSSAKGWGEQKFDLTIGVNDMMKFGYQPDELVIVNYPSKFDRQRTETILKTKPKRMFCHTLKWQTYFPNCELIKLSPFSGYVRNGLIYSCRTSPMVAISLALKQGATEIVLFGVDFKNHKSFNDSSKHGIHEVNTYLKFFERIREKGAGIYLGANGTAFDNKLPLYQPVIA